MKHVSSGILVFIILAVFSCSTKKPHVIPERKMVPLLVDIHIADELGSERYSLGIQENIDSATLYGWIFDKYGVTRGDFDTSMAYYIEHPDIMNDIYNKVIGNLSKMESRFAREETEEATSKVLFEDRSIHRLPQDGITDKIPFDIALDGKGEYRISARIMIRKIDQSVNPHITAYFWYKDTTAEGVRDYFRPVSLKKTDNLVYYSVSKKLTNPKFTNLKGFILDSDNADTAFVKHATVMDIKVTKK